MEYGYFDDAAREYVVTHPRTPVKWINYIGSLAFGGFVDHTGGALICRRDPALNRITKYISQLPASEFKGETLYLRVREGDRYRIFSPYWVPTLDPYDRYECHVGLGYTRIVSEFYGIRADARIFVPRGGGRVLRDIRLENRRAEPVELDAIPVVEYTHPDSLKQLTNADWVPQTMQSRAVRENGGRVLLVQFPFMFRNSQSNYTTSNLPASSFETDRRRFLGHNEYGTWAHPLALEQPELSNYAAQRGDNIAALMHHLGVLAPGETRRLITQLGQGEGLEEEQAEIEAYRDEARVDRAFAELGEHWDKILDKFQVQTPDENLDRMLNIHNPRQCHTTMSWSRYLSLYQLGYGARGIGFRDTAQDLLAVLPTAPAGAKMLIRQLLSVQKRNGSAMHQFNPLTMIASEGDSLEREDRPYYYSDDHLWVILSVCDYIKETGDFGLLDEEVPFYEKGRDAKPLEDASVWEHLRRAVEFTRGDLGAHGLPRLGFADWNDTVNLPAGAESLLAANLYGRALLELIELARQQRDQATAERYSAYHREMRARVESCGWDGEWYLSYFDADGAPLGSRLNDYGQIYVTGQPWPILAGFASAEHAADALKAVHEKLNTRNGIKLSVPAFNGFDPRRGGITTYPPGAKENGGIFLHTNPWVIIAETMMENGERAHEYYCQINPAAQNDRIDEYECEPYVYAQNILGDEHPQFGLARNSWLSGTASWMYVAGTQYLLGIRPAYQGLEIDPCIPHDWPGFAVTREFRGAVYQIQVENPEHVCRGVRNLSVDGVPVSGRIVPLFGDGQKHQVLAIMG